MKILLLTNLFAPDELAGASLYSDMAVYFREQGHDIRVLCSFSYYPAWALRPEDQGTAFRDEEWNEIPVRRIFMYVPEQPNGLKRMLSDLSFFGSILRHQYRDGWLPDVVVTASPMFSQCLAQRFLYPGRKIPRLIIVQDFVVDAALELGILKVPGIGVPLRWLERWSFRAAKTLTTISEPMLRKLENIVGPGRRLVHLPNWIHGSLQAEIYRQVESAPNRRKSLLFYSGNLGVKQGLPGFLETLARARGEWTLEIHGGGAERRRLEEATALMPGVRLGGVLDEASYVASLLTATACLITQAPGVGANFLPSKLLPALATGTPVLAVCEADSPLGREVREGSFGEVVAPGDESALANVLGNWQTEPERLFGLSKNALSWSEKYGREKILSSYEAELRRMLVPA